MSDAAVATIHVWAEYKGVNTRRGIAAEPVPSPALYECAVLYVHPTLDAPDTWSLSDATTGLAMTRLQPTREAAIDFGIHKLRRLTPEQAVYSVRRCSAWLSGRESFTSKEWHEFTAVVRQELEAMK